LIDPHKFVYIAHTLHCHCWAVKHRCQI